MNETQSMPQTGARRTILGIPLPWAITILGAVSLCALTSNLFSFGVFFKPIAADLGWSRSAISGALSFRMIVTALLMIPFTVLSDRYGPRLVVVPSVLVLGAAVALTGTVNSLWQLYVVQGVLIGLATGVPNVIVLTTVAKWHTRRSGLALGITSAGGGLGSIVFPLLSNRLIEIVGWRSGLFVLGAVIAIVGVSSSLLLRNPVSWLESGAERKTAGTKGTAFDVWKELPRYTRQPVFLSLAVMFLLFATTFGMLNNHFVNYATDVGVTAAVAAVMVSAMGLASLTGRLSSGLLSDRFGVRNSLVACFAVVVVGIALLTWNASIGIMWVAVAFLGLGQGGELPLVPAIVGERYGKERLTTVTGMVQTFVMVGSALGPYVGGAIFDWTGSYFWALLLLAGMAFTSLILAWRLGSATDGLQTETTNVGQAQTGWGPK